MLLIADRTKTDFVFWLLGKINQKITWIFFFFWGGGDNDEKVCLVKDLT